MSIMPLLMAAPMNTPIEATMRIRLNEAAFEPIAELRKIYGVIAYTYRQVEDCQQEQEDHDA